MKFSTKIPSNFNELDEKGYLGDSDDITIEDLEKFDKQLNKIGRELAVFENGSAYNWYIK